MYHETNNGEKLGVIHACAILASDVSLVVKLSDAYPFPSIVKLIAWTPKSMLAIESESRLV